MAKTNAERQAEYRRRRIGERRINVWVSDRAADALEQLAARDGKTQKEVLEQLLLTARTKSR